MDCPGRRIMELLDSNRKQRKMTAGERNLAKTVRKEKKKAEKLKKKVATTLDWMHIHDITNNSVILKHGKYRATVMGVKLSPHDIFIDDAEEQERIIENLRMALNKMPFKMYFQFVYSPVNADEYETYLREKNRAETDRVLKRMIEADFEKLFYFKYAFSELEFFVMIQESSEEKLYKNFEEMKREFAYAGFLPRTLDKYDYYNLIAYVFENPLANNFLFSRGAFSPLNRSIEYSADSDTYDVVDRTETFEDYGVYVPNPRQNENLALRSRLAPTGFSLRDSYYILGDYYVTNLLVTQLPSVYELGVLLEHINDPKIKVFLTTEKSSIEIAKAVRKEFLAKEQEMETSRDAFRRSRLQADLESDKTYINQLIRDNDLTFNVTIVFSIYAETKEEMLRIKKNLKSSLSTHMFMTADVKLMQDMVFKYTSPLFIGTGDMPSEPETNVGVLLPSRGVAGLYPFVFETMKDPSGFLLGHEYYNGGIICFDPFYWLHNHEEAVQMQRLNGNVIVVGKSGSGKSTTMNLIIRSMIMNRTRIVWIDPENKNQVLTRNYGGTYIVWGRPNNVINVFDLKKISTDEDEDDENIMYDTELAINNVTSDVNQVLQYLYPGISEDTLTVTGDIVIRAYEKVGIRKDENGSYPSFRDLTYDDMPTFSTFNECLQERILEIKNDPSERKELDLLMDLSIKTKRIINEWGIYFNGHTTVKLNHGEGQIISFGTKMLFNASVNLRTALNHMMFKFSWDLCLDNEQESAFIIDEAHMLILEGKTAEMVAQFYRRARKYHTVMIAGTQQPGDFADEKVITHGKAIFNNAVYKMIMHLDKDDISDISKLVRLNTNETELIQRFTQGNALFVCGNRRIPITVLARDNELIDMGMKKD